MHNLVPGGKSIGCQTKGDLDTQKLVGVHVVVRA